MSLKQIKKVVEDFIGDNRNDLLVLKGEWGVGKTYFWNDLIRKASTAKSITYKHYSYVSLFGVNHLEDLKTEIVASKTGTEAIKESLTVKEWAKDARKMLKDAEKIPFFKDRTGGVLGTVMFRFVNDALICFDDFERRGNGLGIKDVLGLASLLKEQRGCKIVFIINEGVLQPEEKEEFRRHSEKIVDLEVQFSPQPEEVFDLVFSASIQHYYYIKTCCTKLGIKNIRVLQRVRRFIENISSRIKDVEQSVAENVISSLVLFIWCYYQKDKGAPPLSFVMNYQSYERFIPGRNKEESEEEKQWSDSLNAYGFSHSDDLDKQLAILVEVGFCDYAIFNDQLEKKNEESRDRQGQDSYRKAWDLYHDSFDNNQEEFLQELVSSFRNNMKYLSFRNLQNTVEMARAFDKDTIADNLIDEFLDFHKDTPELKVPFRGSDREDINDKYLLQRLKEVISTSKDQRALADVVKKLASSNGRNPEEIDILAKCDVEDYYNFFKSEKSGQLYTYVKTCLRFKGFASGDDQYSVIASKAKDALLKIAQESKINQMRVSTIYEIKLDTDS